MSHSKLAIGAQPTLNFVSTIVLAVIIAEVFVEKRQTKGIVIILGFLLGLVFAIVELKGMMKKSENVIMKMYTKEEREMKLGQFVAELFEEDIPYEEFENNESEEL